MNARSFLRYIFLTVALLGAVCAGAFPAETYAKSSRLAEGRWIKVRVDKTGMHFIPASTLRSWGFTSPADVRVYGYGGARLSDLLSASTYADDVPPAPAVYTDAGIYFYAVGTVTWLAPDKDGMIVHHLSPWSEAGYYYLSATGEEIPELPRSGSSASGRTQATTFTEAIFHEQDLESPGETGHILVGEDFRYTPRRQFTFALPDRVEGTDVGMNCRFFTNALSSAPTLSFSANGKPLTPSARCPVSSGDSYGDTTQIRRTFSLTGNSLNLEINYSASGTVSRAALDALTVNYTRRLALQGGTLDFATSDAALKLAGATAETRVWDVTEPRSVKAIAAEASADALTWLSDYTGYRRYTAWTPGAAMPCPTMVGQVANQNIHGEETPDMIIVTIAAAREQARRLAALHSGSSDSLKVLIVSPEQVFNEFGSGSGDVNAIRRMAKMFYDRGENGGHRLRFLTLMGRATYDNRHATATLRNAGYETLPIWQSDAGSNESYSFCTDDFLSFLDDDSGLRPGADRQCIAVGRIPCRTTEEATQYVDKLTDYMKKPVSGEWKNKYIVVADDQDNGEHLDQAEKFVSAMEETGRGNEFLYNKIYIDAYEKIGGVTKGARDRMFKLLGEGTAWYCYIGHASIDGWTAEGMLRRADYADMFYYCKLPILYAATCTFSRWDGSLDCGAEMLFNNPSGGIIASICPTRPVYISSNGVFTRQMGRAMMERDEKGRFKTVGEIFMAAKNMQSTDANRLRYVLMGDPALRVPTPSNRLVLTEIAGTALDDAEAQPTLKARQQAVIKGYVADPDGRKLDNFNGLLDLSIYDAEESIETLGRGTDDDPGRVIVFDQQGSRLYTGRDSISGGEFEIKVAMPAEIADNWRPAAINMFALADDGTEAMGQCRRAYVYGHDANAPADDTPPVIENLYLNHESFKNGDAVNESPMVFARVSDDIGINLSQAGVGHTLLLSLDDESSFTDVSDYYQPSADGSPSGTVAYPLEDLTAGNHTLSLRVWDTANNFGKASIEFFVEPGQAPTIFDVYTDVNPASTEANFFVRHNRPDATIEVTVGVYDLLGHLLWSNTKRGRSDMFVSSPMTWDLCDGAGHRVNRGIYLYRATVSCDGETTSSKGRRLAVTGQ